MSKPPTQPRDWGSASESLFSEARTHHTPTAGDRERVRNALARRIAQASNAPIAGEDALGQVASKSGLALSTLVTFGLGIVLVVAGVLVFLRAGDAPKRLDTKPPAQAGGEADRPASAPAAQTEAAPSSRAADRSAGAEGRKRKSPAARNATAARTRTAPATKKQPAPASSMAAASRSPTRAPDGADHDESAKETSTGTEDGSANHALPATHEASEDRSAARRDSDSPNPTAAEPEAQPAARAVTKPELDPPDPRAELLFVRRIQAAMLDAKPTQALALCAEHERRWPRGTFVQEREGLRAIAACQSDARDAGARANAFFASYPRGPLAPRVRAACAAWLKAAGSRIPASGATDSQR